MEKLKEKYRKEMAEFARQKIENRRLWNIEESSASLIFMLALAAGSKYIVEVGTSNGYSGMWLALAAEHNGGEVHSVEVDAQRWKLASNNLKGIGNIHLHLGKAEQVLPGFEEGIDFLFIDAGKPGYIDYLQILEPRLVQGAVVVADNITSHPQTTSTYRHYVENSSRYHTMLLEIDAGLLVSYYLGSNTKEGR